MTFDYKIWIKRILSATKITEMIRSYGNYHLYPFPFQEFNPQKFISFQKDLGNIKSIKVNKNKVSINSKDIINKRNIKI